MLLKGHFIPAGLVMESLLNLLTWLFRPNWRHVDNNEVKEFVLESEHSTLLTVDGIFKVFKKRDGYKFGEDCYSWISRWAFAEVPVIFEPFDLYFFFAVKLLVYLRLVYTDKIAIVIDYKVSHGLLAEYTTDPVDVPHRYSKTNICLAVAADFYVPRSLKGWLWQ